MFPVRWVRHDYYGALNVTRAANATEIAKKYRRLALQYHPDKLVRLPKHEHKKAELLFKEIAEAARARPIYRREAFSD